MRLLSHRGIWDAPHERNSERAFRRSIDAGLGVETDVRDLAGKLVIAHDPPRGDEMSLDSFIDMFAGTHLPIALNVKADGLAEGLAGALRPTDLDVKVFDMSVPDMRSYLGHIPTLTRMSEFELTPAFIDVSEGVWLDAFNSEWFDEELIDGLISQGKYVWIVSPELHGRSHHAMWSLIRRWIDEPLLALCTDLPHEARSYFGVQG